MQEVGTSPHLLSSVTNLLSSETVYESAYKTLASEYNVNKYAETNFGYVEPMQYRLKMWMKMIT